MNNELKVAFYTLGCKVNQYETEAIKEKFEIRGHKNVETSSEVIDCVVINTCTVTNMADRKSRQLIRRAKKNNPNCIIAVVGCYSQINPEEVGAIQEVDIVLGNVNKDEVIDLVENYYKKNNIDGKLKEENLKDVDLKNHVKSILHQDEFQELGLTKSLESRMRAYVKIQEGCNRFCTYCIIPFARGGIRSRNKENIIREVKTLVSNGYKEIILTGINTALYGMENMGEEEYRKRLPLEDILEEIENINGDFRIRFSSLEPTVVNKYQVSNLLKYKKLCNHFHLSLQSGSDKVLKEMNRSYTKHDYEEIVDILRKKDPLFGISADVIVGFPGETEEGFQDSCQVVSKSQLCKTHIFKYSKRQNTPAAKRKDQIDDKIKSNRSEIIIDISENTANNFNKLMIGKDIEVLFETFDKDTGLLEGYGRNYVKCYLKEDYSSGGNLENNDDVCREEIGIENLLGQLVIVTGEKIYKDGVLCKVKGATYE